MVVTYSHNNNQSYHNNVYQEYRLVVVTSDMLSSDMLSPYSSSWVRVSQVLRLGTQHNSLVPDYPEAKPRDITENS